MACGTISEPCSQETSGFFSCPDECCCHGNKPKLFCYRGGMKINKTRYPDDCLWVTDGVGSILELCHPPWLQTKALARKDLQNFTADLRSHSWTSGGWVKRELIQSLNFEAILYAAKGNWYKRHSNLQKNIWALVTVAYKDLDSSMFRRGRKMQSICLENSFKNFYHEK